MKTTMSLPAAALALFACAGLVRAHHSGSMYQATPVWLTGTVVGFEPINPHTISTIEARDADGRLRRWRVEGPGQSQLAQTELYLPQVGDVLRICAFPYKPVEELARMFPDADFSARRSSPDGGEPPPALAGHVMVLADGGMRFWEPHGVLAECIRSSGDSRETWLEFLDSNAAARQAWCQQRQYALVQSNAELLELVEAINASIASPCLP